MVQRVERAVGGAGGERGGQVVRDRRGAVHQGRQDAGVDVGEGFGGPLVRRAAGDPGVRGARAGDVGERRDVRGEQAPDVGEEAVGACAGPVDLVDEDQRGQPQPPEGAHQHPGPRLYALHGGQQEHRAVEDLQGALDLGDEVGVAGGVDQVDLGVADREGGDGGTDGDAAAALDRAVVRKGVSGVDAAEPVDGAVVEEQPLGEAGLTGVDVGQDADVQGARGARVVRGLHAGWSPREPWAGRGAGGFRGVGACERS